MDIPDELTRKIFELVAEEHDYTDNSLWCDGSNYVFQWTLSKRVKAQPVGEPHKSTDDSVTTEGGENIAKVSDNRDIHQKLVEDSMKNKLALMLTCKDWSVLAAELMHRTIIVRKRSSLVALLSTLESKGERGKWTKGLFLYHDPRHGRCDLKRDDIDQLLVRLIRHCPNIRALYFDPFTDIGTALGENPDLLEAIRSLTELKFASWYIPFQTKASIANAFVNMPGLSSVRLENSSSLPDEDVDHDSDAPPIHLPSLESFALSRATLKTLIYISTWTMPKLTTLDLNLGFSDSVDDAYLLLQIYGINLRMLSLNAYCEPPASVDVQAILAVCPNLTSFFFNLDWLFREPLPASTHRSLTRIGFHTWGSLFAFPKLESDSNTPPWISQSLGTPLRQHAAENLSSLDKTRFPRLAAIRLLSGLHLMHYMRRGGTDAMDASKSTAWSALRQRCALESIRIEDATGNEFGTEPSFGDTSLEGPLTYELSF